MISHILDTVRDPAVQVGGLWAVASEVTQAPVSTLLVGAVVTVVISLGRYGLDGYWTYRKWREDKSK